MKIEADRETLSAACNLATKVASKALGEYPSLTLTATDGLTVVGVGTESDVRVALDAVVTDHGSVRFPARFLSSLLDRVNADKVFIEQLDESTCVVRVGRSRSKVHLITDDKPGLPSLSKQGDHVATFALDEFLDICTTLTAYAAADVAKGGAPVTGVFFDNRDDELHIVATDGYRLGFIGPRKETLAYSLLVPRPAMAFMRDACESKLSGSDAVVLSSPNQFLLHFSLGSIEYTTRPLNTAYIPWRKFPEMDYMPVAAIDKRSLTDALTRAATAMTDDLATRRYYLIGHTGSLEVRASSKDFGEVSDQCDYDGSDFSLVVSSRVLLDSLHGHTETILFSCNDKVLRIESGGHLTSYAILLKRLSHETDEP